MAKYIESYIFCAIFTNLPLKLKEKSNAFAVYNNQTNQHLQRRWGLNTKSFSIRQYIFTFNKIFPSILTSMLSKKCFSNDWPGKHTHDTLKTECTMGQTKQSSL